ncbi:MAG: Hpt domain-containing protein, partial [Peptostreptococcaceae bacterium]|nr:Hpt domain-containing protein [Peptostreptococcaceae bacterium]
MSGIDSMTEFYVYENMQLLEQLEEILLSGQSDTGELSQEEIEEIFRAMHTIKGSSAMMGYDSLMNLTHSIEDVFDEIRSGRKLTQSKWEEVIDVVLAIIDFLKDEISKVQEGLFPQASIEELYQRSSNLLKEDIEENISYNTQVDETVDEVVNLDSNGMKIKVFFEDGCGMESIRALGVLMSLEGMHSSIKTVPENLEDDCDGEIAQNGLL